MFEDIKLNLSSEAITQRETPHGILRTLFVPPQATTDPASASQLQVRYDDLRLVFVLTTGEHAEALADKTISHLWDNFLPPDATMNDFGELAQNYLVGDARTVADDDSRHAIIMGAFTREIGTGRGWLAWIGTSGLYILDRSNEPMNLETGLALGEGWSPKKGIMPESARVHTDVVLTNTISRLLVFTNVLRPIITEVPSLGRVAIQRVATTQAKQLAAVLLDLKTFPVVKVPTGLSVFYRWEDATHATLFWVGAEDATGFRVQQASTPTFDDAMTLAELSDSRQRIYTVQPPTDQAAYYRVFPMSGDVPGKPSQPVVVTPVPLVAPIIESINWSASGGLRITWTRIVQSDAYELESSPDPDFDSPETAIIYRGSDVTYETNAAAPNGWYYRVRSLNTHFAPRSPSFWSHTRRAPSQLDSPQFVRIASDALTWTPIVGAKSYEVRKFTGQTSDGKSSEQEVFAVEQNAVAVEDEEAAIYQVRAVREIGDEFSASNWSNPATLGGWSGDLSIATIIESELGVSQTIEAPKPKAAVVPTLPDDDTSELTAPAAPSTAWQVLLIGAAATLAIGLIVGLVGGPRLGIGLDPTNTPLNSADERATQSQSTALWVNATERSILSDELNQSKVLGTEQSVSATAEANRFDSLSGTATLDSYNAATVDAQLNAVDTELQDVAASATEGATVRDDLQRDVTNLEATATSGAIQINDLISINQILIDERDGLLQTATVESGVNATAESIYQTDVDNLNTVIDGNIATIGAIENNLATTEAQLRDVEVVATAQSIYVQTLESQYFATATALAPTPTPTPDPFFFGKQD